MSTQLQTIPVLTLGGSVDAYMQAISGFGVLSAEREQQLGHRLVDEGDLEAARELVLSHLRFVVHIAKSYQGYGLGLSDLIQEGNVGLMKAVKRFDPERGVRLVSFAVHWIKAEIHEYILRNWRIVKIATTKAQRKLFFNLRGAKKQLGWLNNDEAQSIADDLGVAVNELRQMEGRLANYDIPFDAPTDADDDAASDAPAERWIGEDNQRSFRMVGDDFDTPSDAGKTNDHSNELSRVRRLIDANSELRQMRTRGLMIDEDELRRAGIEHEYGTTETGASDVRTAEPGDAVETEAAAEARQTGDAPAAEADAPVADQPGDVAMWVKWLNNNKQNQVERRRYQNQESTERA